MGRIEQKQKEQLDRFETEREREERENREIDSYHKEVEIENTNKIYIRTEYLD